MKKICTILALSILLAAYSAPTIDGSSEAAFQASMEKAASSLPDPKRQQFSEDVLALAMGNFDFAAAMAGGVDGIQRNMMRQLRLDGKTAQVIMNLASAQRAEQLERERKQAIDEIAELKARQAEDESAKAELSQFNVTRSRFSFQEQHYGPREPIVELDVQNNTQHAISRVYFEGTIASPGRPVPWLKKTFNYSIRGSLEQGETASWSLAPNMFSAWGRINPPSDAFFTVVAYRLDGPDDSKPLDSQVF